MHLIRGTKPRSAGKYSLYSTARVLSRSLISNYYWQQHLLLSNSALQTSVLLRIVATNDLQPKPTKPIANNMNAQTETSGRRKGAMGGPERAVGYEFGLSLPQQTATGRVLELTAWKSQLARGNNSELPPTRRQMAEEETPQPEITHDAPSLPSSPDPKRTKYTEPAANLSVAAILNDAQPTPTPETPSQPDPIASMASAPNAASNPLAAAQSLPSMPPMAFEPPPPALQVKLLSETAKAPTKGSAFAAGYDLYASKETTVPARGKVLADTDISIAVPAGTYGRVAPRSGLASKHSIDVGAGVIDADYRGPLKVLLFNFSDTDFKVAVGERVAQLIVERMLWLCRNWSRLSAVLEVSVPRVALAAPYLVSTAQPLAHLKLPQRLNPQVVFLIMQWMILPPHCSSLNLHTFQYPLLDLRISNLVAYKCSVCGNGIILGTAHMKEYDVVPGKRSM
ncbi:hypothetical protein KC320_g70 [Hortaea werneckii]|nr:hypothetical protein KC320_g70 [Hortaea werneckii]